MASQRPAWFRLSSMNMRAPAPSVPQAPVIPAIIRPPAPTPPAAAPPIVRPSIPIRAPLPPPSPPTQIQEQPVALVPRPAADVAPTSPTLLSSTNNNIIMPAPAPAPAPSPVPQAPVRPPSPTPAAPIVQTSIPIRTPFPPTTTITQTQELAPPLSPAVTPLSSAFHAAVPTSTSFPPPAASPPPTRSPIATPVKSPSPAASPPPSRSPIATPVKSPSPAASPPPRSPVPPPKSPPSKGGVATPMETPLPSPPLKGSPAPTHAVTPAPTHTTSPASPTPNATIRSTTPIASSTFINSTIHTPPPSSPPLTTKKTQDQLISSMPNSPIPKHGEEETTVAANAKFTTPKPVKFTPTQSPKLRPISHPPSPFTLPPAQINSDGRHPEIELKNVLVQDKPIKTPPNPHNNAAFTSNGKRETTRHDNGTNKKPSDSQESGMRVITLAGENKGAVMELTSPSQKKNGHSTFGNLKINNNNTKPGWKTNNNDKEGKSIDEAKTINNGMTRMQSPPAMNAYLNSNVQGVNNSILYNTAFKHNDPGVHLVLNRKTNGVGLNHD